MQELVKALNNIILWQKAQWEQGEEIKTSLQLIAERLDKTGTG